MIDARAPASQVYTNTSSLLKNMGALPEIDPDGLRVHLVTLGVKSQISLGDVA